jgi:hypothetical protein
VRRPLVVIVVGVLWVAAVVAFGMWLSAPTDHLENEIRGCEQTSDC